MAVVLFLGVVVATVAVLVCCVGLLVRRKADMATRTWWSKRLLVSFAAAMLCLAPFLLGIGVR